MCGLSIVQPFSHHEERKILSVLDISSWGNLHLRQKDLSEKVTKS